MSAAPSLKELEAWMRWIITEPDGVRAALASAEDRYADEPQPSCVSLIRETPGFPARERLDVYAEGYYLRIVHSVAEDFQAVERWMGDEEFRSLMSDYLLDHPSRTPDLLEVGAKLPDYLPGWLEKGEAPFLPDLARLEWARAYAYFAENPKNAGGEALRGKSHEDLAAAVLETAPATALLETDWAVDELRAELRSADWTAESPRPQAPARGKRFLVVYRDGPWPKSESVGEAEFRLLKSARDRLTLGAACGRLAEFPDVTPEQLSLWLSKWTARGAILAGCL